MIALLLPLWMKLRGYVLGVGVALSLIAGVYAKGRLDQKEGTDAAVAKRDAADLKKAKEINDEVSQKSPAQLDTDLNRWMRD